MLSQELKSQIFKLPPSDRLALISAIAESLKDTETSPSDRSSSIRRMRGLLNTEQPAPTDEDVERMRSERRVEKYL